MPTPFMHLQVAEQLLASPQLAEPIRQQLQDHWSAFYFGSVAPDFSAISEKVSRDQAHFYSVRPPGPEADAYLQLWRDYPELADAKQLPTEQATFLVAYVAHLLLDVVWFREVLIPVFLEPDFWETRAERMLSHNTLLVYLDKTARDGLAENAGILLHQATPQNWLPFADDSDLTQWRDLLVPQLAANAPIRTVEVYAGRMKMETDTYRAHLNDPVWLDTHLFQRVPVAQVQARIQQAVAESIALINQYLTPN